MKTTAANAEALVQLTAFRVGSEEYVVDIMRVREIIRPVEITPVRRGPRYVEGVIDLRGEVVPIIDLRRRLGLPAEERPARKIIILTVNRRVIGLVVDAVTEVVRVPRTSLRAAPELLDPSRAPFFLGVCIYRHRTLILLNVRAMVGSDDPIDLSTERSTDLSRPALRGEGET